MKLITLLTDFGEQDGFVGIMKGVICSINPEASVIDLSHQIPAHQISQAAYVLKSAYRYFPAGTIHVVVVDPGVGSRRKIILCQANGQYFLAPDNGVLKYIFWEHSVSEVIEISNSTYFLSPVSDTFHGRDIFAPVAAHLSRDSEVNQFGPVSRDFQRGRVPQLKLEKKAIVGEIIYIDKFGNLISNIPRSAIPEKIQNSKVRVFIKQKIIHRISHSYATAEPHQLLAIWGSSDSLEIAMNQTSAKIQLGVEIGEPVRIEWAETGDLF